MSITAVEKALDTIKTRDRYTLYCPDMARTPDSPGLMMFTNLEAVIAALYRHVSKSLAEMGDRFDPYSHNTVKERVVVIEGYFAERETYDPSDSFVIKGFVDGGDSEGVKLEELSAYADLPIELLRKKRSQYEQNLDLEEAFAYLGRLRRENERFQCDHVTRTRFLDEQKRRFGYSTNVSFDKVVDDLADKAQKYDEISAAADSEEMEPSGKSSQRVSVPEPFGTESAYQEAKGRSMGCLMGSNMNISCALVAELVESFRHLNAQRHLKPTDEQGSD